jgi:hypothetical protein
LFPCSSFRAVLKDIGEQDEYELSSASSVDFCTRKPYKMHIINLHHLCRQMAASDSVEKFLPWGCITFIKSISTSITAAYHWFSFRNPYGRISSWWRIKTHF